MDVHLILCFRSYLKSCILYKGGNEREIKLRIGNCSVIRLSRFFRFVYADRSDIFQRSIKTDEVRENRSYLNVKLGRQIIIKMEKFKYLRLIVQDNGGIIVKVVAIRVRCG